jgi:hypothetical protein
MRNAPWNADDREVLREKWRLINDTASLCELFRQKVEVLRIRVDHVEEGTVEHENLAVQARELFIAVGQQLLESGLTMEDWKWFVEHKIPDEPQRFKELGQHCQQAKQLNDFFRRLEEFIRAVAKAKRKFADGVRLTLNAWEETDIQHTSWFQKVDDGVRIHGRLVEVRGRDADVLHILCQRTNRPSTYNDLAELSKTWQQGLDGTPDKTMVSTKSSIRTCLDQIRKAIRRSFKLNDDHDPVGKIKSEPGWKLAKDLLQSILP